MPTRVCLIPKLSQGGGPTSFQGRLLIGLARRGVEVTFDPAERSLAAVLVIGGTRRLDWLWRARRAGVPVIQRLNGMNWIHRQRNTGLKHTLRAEYGNRLLSLIRARLATRIVYQSRFSRQWWEQVYGATPVENRVIYNGVDLSEFNINGPHERPNDCWRLLVVEGSLGGGYEIGMEAAVGLAERLAQLQLKPVELEVVGKAAPSLQAEWRTRSKVPIHFSGWLERDRIPFMDRSAHFFYASDLNPACPNSVIESMACGLPVLAFHTGALGELVQGQAGRVVPYGGDPWKLDPPDVLGLAQAAVALMPEWPAARLAARRRAEKNFSLEKMVDEYLAALLGG